MSTLRKVRVMLTFNFGRLPETLGVCIRADLDVVRTPYEADGLVSLVDFAR